MRAAWLAVILLLVGWMTIGSNSRPLASRGGGAVGSTPVRGLTTKNIEDIRVGERVVAHNPDLPDSEHGRPTAVDPATWRLVRLRALGEADDGGTDVLTIECLQPVAALESMDARIGSLVELPLDVEDIGLPATIRGEVLSIEKCPTINGGAGSVVLATANHRGGDLWEVTLADSGAHRDSFTITGLHRIYEPARRLWLTVRELSTGDCIQGTDSRLTIVSKRHVAGTARVFNLTIEGEHTYRVSRLGAIVHNSGGSGTPPPPPPPNPNQGIANTLMPGGKPIGTTGSPGVQELPGGFAEAQNMFNNLAKGGTPIPKPGYPGTAVQPPGGGFIGLRPASKSEPPTIDLNVPCVPIKKLKFK